MRNGRRMLISLGAQKAATTWLGNYLDTHPECVRTPVKEVHYFDYFDLGVPDLGKKHFAKRLGKLVRRGKRKPEIMETRKFRLTRKFLRMRLAAIKNGPPNFYEYTKLLTLAATPKTKIVSDITPANGLLSVERLRDLADLDNRPLFTFVMRDPVDRVWSSIRMVAGRGKKLTDDAFTERARNGLRLFMQDLNENVALRSDYASILEKIDAAIPEDRVFVAFFEEFLNQPTIDSLCDFMGVAHYAADVTTPRLSGKTLSMTAAEACALSAKLRPIYDAIEARMGRLPDRWIKNRDLAK